MKSENFFVKKANQRKLNRHQEPGSLAFAAGASFCLALIILLTGFDLKTRSFGLLPLLIAGVFVAEAVIAFVIGELVKKQILKDHEIGLGLRILGFLLLLTIANGNIFCALAGLMLVKKKKSRVSDCLLYAAGGDPDPHGICAECV